MNTPQNRQYSVRRARTYRPIERPQDASDEYPTGCSAFLTSIHDARYYQGLLSNPQNFSTGTRCDLFHVQHAKAEWKNDMAEDETLQYLTVFLHEVAKRKIIAKPRMKESGHDQTAVFRVM